MEKEHIRNMSQENQVKLWHNATKRWFKDPEDQEAAKVRQHLDEVWGEVFDAEMANTQHPNVVWIDPPQHGVLDCMDYHVGENARPQRVRLPILVWVALHHIPFVHSPAYMGQWGCPFSRARYRKLEGVLLSLIESAQHTRPHAARQWHSDLRSIRCLEPFISSDTKVVVAKECQFIRTLLDRKAA